MSKFKVGDIVKGIKDGVFSDIYKAKVIERINDRKVNIKILECEMEEYVGKTFILSEKIFELLEPKTEFTFQEVIEKIKPGEKYIHTSGTSEILTIERPRERIWIESDSTNYAFSISTDDTFKLIESRRNVPLVAVEHRANGKPYHFIPEDSVRFGDFVVCDTKYGQAYGKVIDCFTKALTQKEIEGYKTCKKA